jgi:CxxC-x17-CxxC domain-containing protein
MKNQCYICQQIFETKEKLFGHLDIHAKLKSQPVPQEPKIQEPVPQEPKAPEPKTPEPEPTPQEPKAKKNDNPAVCSDCGAETIVPFKPKEGRPVYCKECLMLHRTEKLKNLANEISLDNK